MQLTLYIRPECGLCQDMEAELRRLQPELGFELQVHDVDRDPRWVERWGHRVPALVHEEVLISEYFLDPAALRAICASGERV